MTNKQEDTGLKWFAARITAERPYVLKYLGSRGIEHSGIKDLRSLLFVRCTAGQAATMGYELYGRVFFYRSADRRSLEPISDEEMETFLRLEPLHEEPVIYINVTDTALFEGQRKRIKGGIFAGCEGVIKRIKGDRRLIIRISDTAAVATPYIPQELLEDIDLNK